MTQIAVVAHRGKSLGGGLPELRRKLAAEGFSDPIWTEVDKSRQAPKAAKRATKQGADLVLVWGGDGMVQRVVDTIVGSGVALAVLPAGTANLFATNLGIPTDLPAAVDIALRGARRTIDVGALNGEHFAVMAGAGLDAMMIERADRKLKARWGRFAYVWTAVRAARVPPCRVRITVDGLDWFKGRASCVLLGSMGTLAGGLVAFPDASFTDGQLEVGVVTADGLLQWGRVFARLVTRAADRSALTRMTRGRRVDVRFTKPVSYELDGGARPPTCRLRAHVNDAALPVCVPEGRTR